MRPSVDQIFFTVSAVCGVGHHFIAGHRKACRRRVIVHARVVAAIVLRQMRSMSYPEIGMAINRHHSSVIELIQNHQHRPQVRRDVSAVVEKVSESLRLQNSPPQEAIHEHAH